MAQLNQLFQEILNLLAQRHESGVDARIREMVERVGREEIRKLVPSDVAVKAGSGKGNTADVPWIAIFPRGVEPSVQSGIYLVYLFAADGSRLYLSINQGTEKAKIPEIKLRAERMRAILGHGLNLATELNLGKSVGRPRKYSYGNAYALVYESGQLPSHDRLVKDLEQMRTLLERLPRKAVELDDIPNRIEDVKPEKTDPAIRISVPLARWLTYRDQGYISIGWPEVGNLLQHNSLEEITAAVEQRLMNEYPAPRQRESVARQLWLFRSLKPGDTIIATAGTSTILAAGRVEEPGYRWDGVENGRGHWIPVTWDESGARRVRRQARWRVTVVDEADSDLVEFARTPGQGLPEAVLDLESVCREFGSALLDSHISFGPRHDEVVRSFVVSLATKRFVILTGLSGSGKTQLAVRFGEWLGPGRREVVAVRPDWTGPEPLFGYEDALQELVNGRRPWHVPKALEFMLKAARDPEHPYLLVLDEMNLAHVERYFADLLSGMESEEPVLPNLTRNEEKGVWLPDPNGPDRIPIPENLFVVGTVNVDETTYMFSPKVLDRANTIEFRVDTEELSDRMRHPLPIEPGDPALVRGFLAIATDPDWHLEQENVDLSLFMEYLRKLHRVLAGSHAQFGHRVVYEANRFAALMAAAGVADVLVALDLQVLQKVLPRVHGSRKRIEPVLRALGQFCFDPDVPVEKADGGASVSAFDPEQPPESEPTLPRSFAKIQRMMRILRADQFVSFAE